MSVRDAVVMSPMVAVAVDVGKKSAALSVTDAARRRLLGPVEFTMTASGLRDVTARAAQVVPVALW